MIDIMRTTLLVVISIMSHLLFFMHDEHHMQAPTILCAFFVIFSALVSVFVRENGDLWDAMRVSSFIAVTYSLSLVFSMILYRLLFHQLRQFPGPISARISKLWHATKLISKPNFLLLEELHCRYGEIVRTGELLPKNCPESQVC